MHAFYSRVLTFSVYTAYHRGTGSPGLPYTLCVPFTSSAPYFGWEILPSESQANFSNATLEALAQYPADWPQIEYLSLGLYSGSEVVCFSNSYETLAAALITPQSRGNVTINSTSTTDPPFISPNYFTDPSNTDIQIAIAGFRRLQVFWASNPMTSIKIGDGDGLADYTTDAEIEQLIRSTASTVHHASCTCKMGVEGDAMAVVDSAARVFGVKGLTVVDFFYFSYCIYRSLRRSFYLRNLHGTGLELKP